MQPPPSVTYTTVTLFENVIKRQKSQSIYWLPNLTSILVPASLPAGSSLITYFPFSIYPKAIYQWFHFPVHGPSIPPSLHPSIPPSLHPSIFTYQRINHHHNQIYCYHNHINHKTTTSGQPRLDVHFYPL